MAERIDGLSIGLDLDTLALDRGLTGVKDRLRTVNSEMKLNMSAFDRGDRSIQKYDTRLQGLNKKLETQRKVTDEARKEYERMVEEHGEGSAEAEKAERAYNNQAAALNNLERYVGNATKELEKMRKEQAFQESSWGKLSTNLDKVSKRTGELGKTFTGFGKTTSKRVTAPIMAAGGAAFAAADQIDKAYRDIRVSSGATGEALEDLENSFDNVFTSVPDGADIVSASMMNLNTHTDATGDVLEGLSTNLLDVSRLLGEDATSNADAFGRAMQQWQRPAEDGAATLDYLYTLTQDYNVGLGEISGQLTTYGAVLNNAGFEMEESAHFMAALEANGIAVSRIMPGLNSAFRRWADEGKNSREELENVIEAIAETEDKQKALSMATEAFGAEGAQRLMTAIRNRAIPAFEDLGSGADDATGAIAETAAETQTIGEQFQELRNNTMIALRPVGEILLDLGRQYMPPLIDGVRDLAEWFDNLDDSTKRNILAFGGVAAAVGPASLALGGMFNVVSSLTGGLSRVVGIIGRAGASGGTGLLARLAMLGPAGTVGIAIAGVAGLAGGIYALTRDKEELHDINLDVAQSLSDEHAEISQAAEAYQNLRTEARLNNDEFGELLDIKEELAKNPEGEALEELQSRYEELREKSGLTNEQLDELIKHNQTIVDNAPQTAEAHSEQGNAIAGVNEELEGYLDTLRETSLQEIELEKMKFEENKLIHLRDINEAKEREKELTEQIGMISDLQKMTDEEREQRYWEIVDAQSHYLTSEEEAVELAKEEEVLRGLLNDGVVETIDNLKGQMEEQREIIANAETELEKGQALDDLYAEIHLKKLDINESGEEGIRLAEEQLEKLREEREQLDERLRTEGDITGELKGQISEKDHLISQHENVLSLLNEEENLSSELIDNEQRREAQVRHVNDVLSAQAGQLDRNNSKIKDGTEEAKNMNDELGKDIPKTVDITTQPSIASLEERLGRSVLKPMNLTVTGGSAGLSFNAKGTDFHPGGPSFLGEEGQELVKLGNRWAMAGFGLYDLPRGAQVFTHDESREIVGALNNLPAYASGISYENEPTQTMRMIAAAGRRIINREQTGSIGQSGNQASGVSNDTNITQNITINSPEHVSPAETARRLKQASRQLAMEWR